MFVDGSEQKSGIFIVRTKYKCMLLPSHFSSSFVFIQRKGNKKRATKRKENGKEKSCKKNESFQKPFSAFDPKKIQFHLQDTLSFLLCVWHICFSGREKKFHIQQIIIILTSKMVRTKVFVCTLAKRRMYYGNVYAEFVCDVGWRTVRMKCTSIAEALVNARGGGGGKRSKKNEQFNLILAAYYHRNNQSVWGFFAMKNLFCDWSFLFDTIIGCACIRRERAMKRRSESESKILIFDRKTKRKKRFFVLFAIQSNKVLAFNTFFWCLCYVRWIRAREWKTEKMKPELNTMFKLISTNCWIETWLLLDFIAKYCELNLQLAPKQEAISSIRQSKTLLRWC